MSECRRPTRGRRMSAAVVVSILLLGLASAESLDLTGANAPVVNAVWKPQNVDFHYQSFTTFYSCSSLAEKVRRILVELGGDDKTRVRVSGCEAGSGIARMPLVRITMTSPVEATPAVLAELQKTRPVRELAARVRNDRAKQAQELDSQFPARWKPVSLSRGSLGLAPGDCELVEQIERKVLPKLAVRVVSSELRCTPNQVTLGQPKLEVEALADLPKADAGGKVTGNGERRTANGERPTGDGQSSELHDPAVARSP